MVFPLTKLNKGRGTLLNASIPIILKNMRRECAACI